MDEGWYAGGSSPHASFLAALNQGAFQRTDFQKHMSREEQIAFLKSIKKTIHLNRKEKEIYEEIHLIADDALLKLFEPILKKEIKL